MSSYEVHLQISCTPVQVEVDVLYFPIFGELVMDVFFSGLLVDSSDKENPAFHRYWVRKGWAYEHPEENLQQDSKTQAETSEALNRPRPHSHPTASTLRSHRRRSLTALGSRFVAVLLHAVVVLPHPRSGPLF